MKYYKIIKVRCRICGDMIIAKSPTEWETCQCGEISVRGDGSWKSVRGTNYDDYSIINTEIIPNSITEQNPHIK